ncbi:hypothetical protein [Pedobacter agri]|uniref:Uncharacterized protein n=1 Tax=Pedobacter agri TaxID=454586 RepID=A0A9X3DCN4_9SPHI|nr:hypothetical protein [Pedobacter agri]MCX3263715.1 hypothetical protein [Pedobacter agri]
MRRYFYRNEENTWIGPYSPLMLVLHVLMGKIHIHTAVWWNTDSNSPHKHPS